MTEYVPQEYPKYIASKGVIVENAEQERAVLADEAKVEVVKASEDQGGDQVTVVCPPAEKKE